MRNSSLKDGWSTSFEGKLNSSSGSAACCVTLGKVCDLSVPVYSSQRGGNRAQGWGRDGVTTGQELAHREGSINVGCVSVSLRYTERGMLT